MAEFNRKEFGDNLRRLRKAKGLSQENLGDTIGRTSATVARYESGEIIPDAEQIQLICDELGIYANDLFNSSEKIKNKENSINPFKTDILYLYYIAYFPKTNKYGKGKFILKLTEKPDCCKVDFLDYKDKSEKKIYLSGYLLADSNIAVFSLENNKEFNLRLELTHIILNIARGTNGLMLGSLHCTNGNYVPSERKCIISKENLEFTDEMLDRLKYTEDEIKNMTEKNILYVDVLDKYDFED